MATIYLAGEANRVRADYETTEDTVVATTIADAAQRYGVTTMNATRMVNHLVEVGILQEMTGRS